MTTGTPLPTAELVRDQANKIELDCDRAAIRDSLVSADWDKANRWLGIAAALLAAGAASTAFQGGWWQWVTSVAAVLSALLGSTLTFLSPSQKASAFQKTSIAYRAMRDRLRAFEALECLQGGDGASLKGKFETFLEEKRKIDADHPIVPQSYYRKAIRIIETKEATKRKAEIATAQADSALKAAKAKEV